jgi:opacity protein-like surface antigen
MKKSTLALLALSAGLLASGLSAADAAKKPAAPAAPAAEKAQRLYKIGTLKTVEQNREFTAAVQFMQAQRQAAIELTGTYEKETNAAKKKELKTKLDDLIAKLNENNQKMIKAYGFSLDRNYTLEIETAHIYMLVTEEEAAKFEKDQAAAAAAAAKKK